MKKLFFFFALISVLVFTVSCSNKKQPNVNVTEGSTFVYSFTKADTTEVLNLVSQFMARLENHDIRDAVEMLRFLDGDSIKEATNVIKTRRALTFSTFPVLSHKVDRIVFNSDIDNEVKIDMKLFEKEENDPRPNTTSLYLRPVKFEGKWYLTTIDTITDTNAERSDNETEE